MCSFPDPVRLDAMIGKIISRSMIVELLPTPDPLCFLDEGPLVLVVGWFELLLMVARLLTVVVDVPVVLPVPPPDLIAPSTVFDEEAPP